MARIHVLHHTPCLDGFAGAFAVWVAHHDNPDIELDFFPMKYGYSLPFASENGAWKNDEVVLVDFSFKRAEILELAKRCSFLVVIDHHKTAEAELEGIDKEADNVDCIFNMDHSGCALAWSFFNPESRMPPAFKYIEDRDLWRWKYGDTTRDITAGLSAYDLDSAQFQWWSDTFFGMSEDGSCKALMEGRVITRYMNRLVSSICDKAGIQEIDGYRVPLVNSPILQSEIGHELLERYPDASFAATFFEVRDKFRTYSLRARDDGFDVSKVAVKHGGGGHRGAAGFREDIEHEQPSGKLYTAEQHPAKEVPE